MYSSSSLTSHQSPSRVYIYFSRALRLLVYHQDVHARKSFLSNWKFACEITNTIWLKKFVQRKLKQKPANTITSLKSPELNVSL